MELVSEPGTVDRVLTSNVGSSEIGKGQDRVVKSNENVTGSNRFSVALGSGHKGQNSKNNTYTNYQLHKYTFM